MSDFGPITVDHDSDFPVTLDRQKRVITICGIKYAFDLFRGLGLKIDPGAFFQVIKREDDVVTIRESRALIVAAERVCWFDWSGNNPDAVAAIEELRGEVSPVSLKDEA